MGRSVILFALLAGTNRAGLGDRQEVCETRNPAAAWHLPIRTRVLTFGSRPLIRDTQELAIMDDTHCYQFFQAARYGFTHGALRNLIHDFREACRDGSPPPFSFRSDEDGHPQTTTHMSMKS